MSDEEIIRLYFSRDEAAILASQERYGAYCRKTAANVLSSSEDIEECLNDTWLRAWNAIPPERPRVLRAWLARVTKNLAINLFKKQRAEKRGTGEFTAALDELTDMVSLSQDNVSEQLNREALTECIEDFLRGESASARRYFIRRYFYTESIAEIAERFHAGESAVKVSLHRTRKALREVLEKEGFL